MKENEKIIEVAKELLGEKKFNDIIKDTIRQELQEYFDCSFMDDLFNDEKFKKQLVSIRRNEALNIIQKYVKTKEFKEKLTDSLFFRSLNNF